MSAGSTKCPLSNALGVPRGVCSGWKAENMRGGGEYGLGGRCEKYSFNHFPPLFLSCQWHASLLATKQISNEWHLSLLWIRILLVVSCDKIISVYWQMTFDVRIQGIDNSSRINSTIFASNHILSAFAVGCRWKKKSRQRGSLISAFAVVQRNPPFWPLILNIARRGVKVCTQIESRGSELNKCAEEDQGRWFLKSTASTSNETWIFERSIAITSPNSEVWARTHEYRSGMIPPTWCEW